MYHDQLLIQALLKGFLHRWKITGGEALLDLQKGLNWRRQGGEESRWIKYFFFLHLYLLISIINLVRQILSPMDLPSSCILGIVSKYYL